jgi:hypothetical protein
MADKNTKSNAVCNLCTKPIQKIWKGSHWGSQDAILLNKLFCWTESINEWPIVAWYRNPCNSKDGANTVLFPDSQTDFSPFKVRLRAGYLLVENGNLSSLNIFAVISIGLGFIWRHKSDGGSTLKQNTVTRVSRLLIYVFALCLVAIHGISYHFLTPVQHKHQYIWGWPIRFTA